MSSRPPYPKPLVSLRQELFARPSTSVLAFAMLNAAALSVEGTPSADPTPTPQGTDPSAQRASNASSAPMDRMLIEETLDRYKPEQAYNPKRPLPLLDTPQTISVVPQKVIQDQNATNLRDILRNVPGVTIQAGEGGNAPGDNFIIRGFSARTDLYVHGVRDLNGFYRDPYNIEQVEVTKGPASVYTGRGSTGGSINIITKQPGTREFFALNTGIGTEDYNRDTVDVNLPFKVFGGNTASANDGRGDVSKENPSAPAVVSTNNAAFRLNAMFHTDEVAGRNDVSNQRWGVAPSIAFGLGTPTQLNISYQHLEQNNMPDFGIPWVTVTNVPLAPYRNLPAPVSWSNYYGLNGRDHEFLRTDELEAVLSHDFSPDLNIRDTFHAGRNYRDSIISAPRFISNNSTNINREFQSRDEVDSIITNEIDLTWRVNTFGLKHIVLAGFEYTRQGFENYLRATPANTPLADLFNPDPDAPFPGKVSRTGAKNYGANDAYAAYIFDTVQIGKQWQVSGGARYDYFSQEYNIQAVNGTTTTIGRLDKPVSWRAALLYKPVEIGSIYFGAGSSFNPSGEDITLTTATGKLEPEHTTSYEIGTKWDLLDRRLAVDAALFYTLKDNARTPGATAADPVTVLEGEQRARGFDLEFKGKLTENWEVIGGYTYTQSKILNSNTPAEVSNKLPGVADNTFSFWTEYNLPHGFEAGFGTQFISERYANPINTRLADSFFTVDAMAAYHVNKHLTLRMNVYNFTDERYIGALHTGGSYGHFFPGPRRSATLTASLTF